MGKVIFIIFLVIVEFEVDYIFEWIKEVLVVFKDNGV